MLALFARQLGVGHVRRVQNGLEGEQEQRCERAAIVVGQVRVPERASFGKRGVRALELTALGSRLPSAERLWTEETRHPTIVFGLDLSREVLEERIEARARAMFAAGVKAEVDAALADGPSSTVAHALGLWEISQLPPGEALRALIVRTRRYAAYQRKWMRRIPSLVSVNADRPPDDIADEIVEVARARQRLPAGRAG